MLLVIDEASIFEKDVETCRDDGGSTQWDDGYEYVRVSAELTEYFRFVFAVLQHLHHGSPFHSWKTPTTAHKLIRHSSKSKIPMAYRV